MSKHKLTSLKTQRTANNFSVTTLAKKANVSDMTIIRAENGEAQGPDEANRIANAIGVSLGTLGDTDF